MRGGVDRASLAIRMDRAPITRERERKKSPPAPLCGDTNSLRLDQAGQRVEQLRRVLLATGLWSFNLCFFVGMIAAIISGGGQHTESTIFVWTTGGVAAAGVLPLLAYFLVGRRTSDWWRPRMRETTHTSERETKRRYRMAKRVRRQIRAAQIFDRRRDGGGTLLTEPILVLYTRCRGSLAIFDQEGNRIGSAVRRRDPRAESPGSVLISDVRDSQGQTVLAIHLAERRRRWPKSLPNRTGTYSVCSSDGRELVNIGQPAELASRTVTAGTDVIARLGPEKGQTIDIGDADERQVAQITTKEGWYVVNCKAPVDEPLRSLVLAAGIVWADLRMAQP
jgi:hypothetical protein